jgi:hypothetical protein
MKHLKGFLQLNEAKQDGIEIMDFISTSPEGSDLMEIIGNGRPIADVFDLKRTGRLWILGSYGSKTYIEKTPEGKYGIYSLSNGVIFSSEVYDTIQQTIRALWTNAMGKKITSLGIKKKDYRDWAESTIQPGLGLSPEELISRYSSDKGLSGVPDVKTILNSSAKIKMLKIFFDELSIEQGFKKGYFLINIPLKSKIVPEDCFNNPAYASSSYRLAITIPVIPKAAGKSKIAKRDARSAEIILAGNNPEVDFERLLGNLIKRFTVQSDEYSANVIYKYISRCPIVISILNIISDSLDTNSPVAEDIFNQLADKIIAQGDLKSLSQVEKQVPVLWDIIVNKMGDRKAKTASRLGDLGF